MLGWGLDAGVLGGEWAWTRAGGVGGGAQTGEGSDSDFAPKTKELPAANTQRNVAVCLCVCILHTHILSL